MRTFTIIILIITFALLSIRFHFLETVLQRNLISLNLSYNLEGTSDKTRILDALGLEIEGDCNSAWLLVIVSDEIQNGDVLERAIHESLNCRPENVTLLWRKFPERTDLAKLATETWPKSAEAWFWLGQSLTHQPVGRTLPIVEAQRQEIIDYYKNGLELSAFNSVLWRELGDLLEPIDPKEAIQAYYMSCLTGDKGNHGCYRAGLTSEALSDYEQALYYFRLSDWPGSHEYADKLEMRLTEVPNP